MDRHGTTLLVVEIALLAVGTVGAIAVDELGHREMRRTLRDDRPRPAGDDDMPEARS
jgi:hypothetical protein